MNNILILGHGYVGTEITSYFQTEKTSGSKIFNQIFNCSKFWLNYHDSNTLAKFMLNNAISYVVNCSGFTGKPNVDEAELRKEDCWHLNVKVPLMISDLCKKLDVQYIHISSGCIYSGYDKHFTEEDVPNFGLYDASSFYSKSKHAFETLCDYGAIIRIRMPISDTFSDRNYLTKIVKYDNLVNYLNSKTYVPDIARLIEYLIKKQVKISTINKLNFVNPNPLNTMDIVRNLRDYNFVNPNWKFVPIKDLNIIAPRSNCVLSIDKLKSIAPDFEMNSEETIVKRALDNISNSDVESVKFKGS